jgi:hypothetical protein
VHERAYEPGAEAIRIALGIEQEDPQVFRPNTFDESLKAARIIRDDDELTRAVRGLVEVGLVLDTMPDHLQPRRADMARRLGVTVRTIRRRELRWEGIDPVLRAELVRRAMRLVISCRAAALPLRHRRR